MKSTIFLQLRFADDRALGPGKIRLLELIDETGSIAAASREMAMSYPRAWKLVGELNAAFCRPLVVTAVGGAQRGGATITPLGHDIVRRYRSIETRIYTASGKHLDALAKVLA